MNKEHKEFYTNKIINTSEKYLLLYNIEHKQLHIDDFVNVLDAFNSHKRYIQILLFSFGFNNE